MQWKMNRAGREIRICAQPVRATHAYKEYRNYRRQVRKSEESIVPFEEQRQHNSAPRKGTLLYPCNQREEDQGDCACH